MTISLPHRAALLALALPLGGAALADGPRLGAASHPLYQQECGSCHLPYPPRLLPAASWNAVMDGLSDHFGSDASLTAEEAATLRQFLTANAGRRAAEKNGKPLLRITETAWFVHEHSEEMPASVFRRKEVGSAANCGACHTKAAQGSYNEHDIRIPGGGR